MKSRVALIKGDNRQDNILRAVELIQEDLMSKVDGQGVIVKPNCLQPAKPLCCSHVDALRGVLDFLSHSSPESVTVAETCRDSERFESFKMLIGEFWHPHASAWHSPTSTATRGNLNIARHDKKGIGTQTFELIGNIISQAGAD